MTPKQRHTAFAGLLLVAVLALASWALVPPRDGVTVHTVSYGPHARHRADVYEAAPATAGAAASSTRTAVLLIHGGGWRAGGRGEFADLARWLARQGMVPVAIDYRLVPHAQWPAQAEDVEQAVWWLREQAPMLRIDAHRVVAIGGSAGGHLAAWLGTTNRMSPRGTPSRVNAVVSLAAPWDLSAGNLHDEAKAMITALVGPQAPRMASPLFRVDTQSAPALLIHGTRDELVPPDQSTRACDALRAVQVPCEVMLLDGEAHALKFQRTDPAALLSRIQAFIAARL